MIQPQGTRVAVTGPLSTKNPLINYWLTNNFQFDWAKLKLQNWTWNYQLSSFFWKALENSIFKKLSSSKPVQKVKLSGFNNNWDFFLGFNLFFNKGLKFFLKKNSFRRREKNFERLFLELNNSANRRFRDPNDLFKVKKSLFLGLDQGR